MLGLVVVLMRVCWSLLCECMCIGICCFVRVCVLEFVVV